MGWFVAYPHCEALVGSRPQWSVHGMGVKEAAALYRPGESD